MPVAIPMTLEERLHRIQVRINRLSEKEETSSVLAKIERLRQIEQKLQDAIFKRGLEEYEAAAPPLEQRLEKIQKRIERQLGLPDNQRSRDRIERLREVEAKLQRRLVEAKISDMVDNHTIGESSEA